MRQPKFRGYSFETKSWHYGHGWYEIDFTEEYKQKKGIEDRALLYTEGFPIDCELASMGEFTGLKDKKAKEIYEADIFKNKNGVLFEIYYCLGECAFLGRPINRKYQGNGSPLLNKNGYLEGEIIGNIYQHPHLLEEDPHA